MSYCINPRCPEPSDPGNLNNRICRNCGSPLLIQGRYQVMRLLSDTSGFGMVYEAYLGAIPKILKALKPKHNKNPKVIELFQQEAAVLSQLNHPGIPQVESDGYFQFIPQAGEPLHCIIMEKIDGLNLKQWMRQQGNHPISESQALNWLKQLVEILHLVHQKNYFHRDIKPENIMLRPTGQLVLIDFGTARELTYTYLAEVGGAGNVTKISSAGYTPPEQEKGYAVPQSDFYALGRTFVYLLTAKSVTDPSMYDPLTDRCNWREQVSRLSTPLADLIDKLMAPTAATRHKTTQEIMDELANISSSSIASAISSSLQLPNDTRIQAATLPQEESAIMSQRQGLISQNKWVWLGTLALALGIFIYQFRKIDTRFPAEIAAYQAIELVQTINANASYINYLIISPDGETLVSGNADKTIRLWHLKSGQEIRKITGYAKPINYFAINSDGDKIVTGSGEKIIQVWDFATQEKIKTLTGHSSFVNYLVISPDGKTLVSGSADKTIKFWDLATGQEIRTLTGHSSSVNYLVISPDGKTLVSGSADKTIKLWDLATGQEIRTLTGHSSSVNALEISPDGKTLVSGSADKTIKLWDLATGQEIRTMTGHSSFVNALAISPDGQVLASGSADKTIKLWQLSTGQLIRTLKGHLSSVNSIVISPDGETLVSGSADKTIKLWRVPKSE
ncbi:protein kinase domain-containing protein [Coleofasciculus sp. G2-EDA-02]|uniref:protein kinase domain-containing protein n=1 Tax=Coleofasciculus sp. G2-EDA-02 TaxID=3069529 RepID=UPI0032F84413